MINIKFFVHNGQINGYELSGHSGYAPYGRDIVCAAVSSAAEMTANTITQIIGINAEISQSDDGFLKVLIPEGREQEAQVVLKGLRLHLRCIAKDFSANVRIRYGGTNNA
ncbi:MAG: ribosomal-processing cysteine protease Prp [Clostridiales bacterium]|jgi:uncharacterized protein YsxB (DUF464 family)|nr:ribosomal-processing cysteine protease Prp [Clostridiales bacterium]